MKTSSVRNNNVKIVLKESLELGCPNTKQLGELTKKKFFIILC